MLATRIGRLPRHGIGRERLGPRRALCFANRPSSALVRQQEEQAATALAITRRRNAERKRFGLPVLHLLGLGLLGGALVLRWWRRSYEAAHRGKATPQLDVALGSHEPVTDTTQAAALMAHVREVLHRHGLSLGHAHLNVSVRAPRGFFGAEGLTVKGLRPPPALRGVEAVVLQPGLPALHAAQVLAHEFMHAWMWLQGFPPLEPALEEGLCELASYLYLLSCLKEPLETGTLRRDEAHLRAQIRSIEANAHPDYGGGFRACAAALRHMPREGGQLHQLLGHVRQHGVLPPEARARVKTSSGA